MFGTQERHLEIRSFLTEFISLNPSQFDTLCCPKSVSAYVSHMKHNFVWGTHVEILAAAVSFHKPAFTAVQKRINDDNSAYYWAKYDREPQSNLVYPTDAPSFKGNEDVGHLEICLENEPL